MYTLGILILVPLLFWKPKQTIIISGLVFLLFICIVAYTLVNDNDLKLIKEHKLDGKKYSLFQEGDWLSDKEYYLIKLGDSQNSEDYHNKYDINTLNSLLSNIESNSQFDENPDLLLLENRFLIIQRGGLYFGLYDLKFEDDIVNVFDPMGEWNSQSIWTEKGTYYKGEIAVNERSDYGIWVKQNLDQKIREYMTENK